MAIEEVFEKHRGRLMQKSGVVGVGLIEIEDKKSIAVFVFKDQWWEDRVKVVPKTLGGYELHVIPTYDLNALGTGRLL